jgi:hypothetical protein
MSELDTQYPNYNVCQHKVTLACRAANVKTQ